MNPERVSGSEYKPGTIRKVFLIGTSLGILTGLTIQILESELSKDDGADRRIIVNDEQPQATCDPYGNVCVTIRGSGIILSAGEKPVTSLTPNPYHIEESPTPE